MTDHFSTTPDDGDPFAHADDIAAYFVDLGGRVSAVDVDTSTPLTGAAASTVVSLRQQSRRRTFGAIAAAAALLAGGVVVWSTTRETPERVVTDPAVAPESNDVVWLGVDGEGTPNELITRISDHWGTHNGVDSVSSWLSGDVGEYPTTVSMVIGPNPSALIDVVRQTVGLRADFVSPSQSLPRNAPSTTDSPNSAPGPLSATVPWRDGYGAQILDLAAPPSNPDGPHVSVVLVGPLAALEAGPGDVEPGTPSSAVVFSMYRPESVSAELVPNSQRLVDRLTLDSTYRFDAAGLDTIEAMSIDDIASIGSASTDHSDWLVTAWSADALMFSSLSWASGPAELRRVGRDWAVEVAPDSSGLGGSIVGPSHGTIATLFGQSTPVDLDIFDRLEVIRRQPFDADGAMADQPPSEPAEPSTVSTIVPIHLDRAPSVLRIPLPPGEYADVLLDPHDPLATEGGATEYGNLLATRQNPGEALGMFGQVASHMADMAVSSLSPSVGWALDPSLSGLGGSPVEVWSLPVVDGVTHAFIAVGGSGDPDEVYFGTNLTVSELKDVAVGLSETPASAPVERLAPLGWSVLQGTKPVETYVPKGTRPAARLPWPARVWAGDASPEVLSMVFGETVSAAWSGNSRASGAQVHTIDSDIRGLAITGSDFTFNGSAVSERHLCFFAEIAWITEVQAFAGSTSASTCGASVPTTVTLHE